MKVLPLRLSLTLRWLALAACMAAHLVLNQQRVATWHVAAASEPAQEGGTLLRPTVTVRERVVLTSVAAEAPVLAPQATAWLPLDPLGAWRGGLSKALRHCGLTIRLALRPVPLGAEPVFARLLGAIVSPQAP